MNTQIIDLPRIFMRAMQYDWDIDWSGQSAGPGLDASDQLVLNRFPRFVGNPTLVLPRPMIGHFRAIRAQAHGRANAWRLRMVDPVSNQLGGANWRDQWAAYLAGDYIEARPQIVTTASAAAGDTEIGVDETSALRPVPVGAYLSYDDWPFIVTGRSGSGSAVTLQVEMLRTAIPSGGSIDLSARGLFKTTDGMAGNPIYGAPRSASAELSFVEWITR